MTDQTGADILDAALQQSQMVFFCIPGVGPMLAAGASIWGAIRQANKIPPRESYSVEMAIADLGERIQNSIGQSETQALLRNTKAWQLDRGDKDLLVRDADHNPDASGVVPAFATFLTDATPTMWAGLGDDASALDRWIVPKFAADSATAPPAVADPLGWADPTRFAPATDRRALTRDDVAHLDMYCMAHAAFHARCLAYLKWGAAAFGYDNWAALQGPVRSAYEHSLIFAIDHLAWVLGTLRTTIATMDGTAEAYEGDDPNPGETHVGNYTKLLRKQRNAVFLDNLRIEKLDTYLQFLDIFGQALQGLRLPQNTPTVDLGLLSVPATATTGTPTTGSTLGTSLGPRAANTVRFLYESDGTGHYIDVVANPTVLASGSVATQNAGSAKATLYYQVGGGGVNLLFATQLSLASQLDGVNATALPHAYDAEYGAGAWAVDSAVRPTPRQDRLTSLLIGLSDGDPVGDRVVAMIYSAAPDLGASGLSDAAVATSYTAIYRRALDRIADWNTAHPAARIVAFRVTMLSTGLNSGLQAGPALDALRAKAAQLILDAIVAGMTAATAPSGLLDGLTILVNNEDASGGAVRSAFDAAATALQKTNPSVAMAREGFDIPC